MHQADSLFRSQDAGKTWQVVFPPDRPHCQRGVIAPEVKDIHFSPNYGQDQTLYMVTQDENGLYLLALLTAAYLDAQLRQRQLLRAFMGASAAAGATPVLVVKSTPHRQARAQDDLSRPSTAPIGRQDQEWTTVSAAVDWAAAAAGGQAIYACSCVLAVNQRVWIFLLPLRRRRRNVGVHAVASAPFVLTSHPSRGK